MIKKGTEEYQLEIFKLSASAPPKKENICQICEGVGELIECLGSCQGHFHANCLGIATVPVTQFKCDECQTGNSDCVILSLYVLRVFHNSYTYSSIALFSVAS